MRGTIPPLLQYVFMTWCLVKHRDNFNFTFYLLPGAPSLGVKRPWREADHSPPSNAEVKNAWSYTSTPQYVFMAWCLVKHGDNFTFTLK
jgi:hypothetical protein